MSDKAPVITLDGPSGVGKGTISLMLANRLGWHFLDSGALYRLTALAATQQAVDFSDEAALAECARKLDVHFEAGEKEVSIFLNQQLVNDAIRTEEAGKKASIVAAVPAVREALLQRQRDFRRSPGLIADGRDMGTTVFPDAPVKIFLDANAEVRAQRRYKQLMEKGLSANLSSLVHEIRERDERDRSRVVSPLKPAADAKVIDTSELGVTEVFELVLDSCSALQRNS